MKITYMEPEVEIFLFRAEDQIVASAVIPGTVPLETETPEDPVGDAESVIDWWNA